ncbi:MAG: HlyD family efflux transporter periplasmic adaptor subunit [Sediminibacterium sp.]|nr:HlyD family efflux transporter periplasmic adaptor subunit [Sediminibacterium sp.]
MSESKNFEMRTYEYSDEIKSIIGKPPSKFVKYGSLATFIILGLLVVVCLIIQYPEEQKGVCIIYSDPLPQIVAITKSGVLDDIFVEEGEIVNRNKVLAIIKNSGSISVMCKLDSMCSIWLSKVERADFYSLDIPSSISNIGDLREDFNTLYLNFLRLKVCLADPLYRNIQFSIITRDDKAANSRRPLTSKRSDFNEYEQSFFNSLINFSNSINALKARIREWKEEYVLVAPRDGKIFFSSIFFRNMNLEEGRPFIYVVPLTKLFYAQVTLTQEHFEVVKIGQKVNISLEGMSNVLLEGIVSSISQILDHEGKFTIKVKLNTQQANQLNRNIDLRNDLRGSASIITGSKSLFRKLFNIKNN